MNFQPNKLYFKIAKLFADRNPNELLIVGNEGSARAAKTYDAFHFFVAMCDANRDNPQEIYFVRDTLVNCRDYTLNEFKRCLGTFYDEEGNKHGIGIWDNENFVGSPKPTYNLFGHKIKFRGIDEIAEAFPSDFIFFNEVLDQPFDTVKSLLMRCRKMAIMDWNPKYSINPVFDMVKQPNVVFTKTTYKDNRFAPKSFIQMVESYNPAIPENVTNGTADIFRWKVYGLGERANREGLVFPNVTWIDEFPSDIQEISYGCDFGQANPTAIVKIGVRRNAKPMKDNLYIKKLFYAPTETSDVVAEVMTQIAEAQIAEACVGKEFHSDKQKQSFTESIDNHILNKVWCDSNMGIEKGWISDLRNRNIQALATRKFPGSREYWISTIKRFNIHMVKDPDLRKEQENFCYRVVDGITLSETIKKHDHALSAIGYSVTGDFRIDDE